MPSEPINLAQLLLIVLAVALFLAGAGLSIMQHSVHRNGIRLAAKGLNYWAILIALVALVWHIAARKTGGLLPLGNNFETLTLLSILLAIFSMYIQRARPIPGLDWFLLPIVVLMLVLAAVFGRLRPDAVYRGGWWSWTHVLSSFGGAAAFAVAAAVGCLYLLLSARLRHKPALPAQNLGSLERLERVTQSAVSLGFALLTLSMITGLIRVLHEGSHTALGAHWYTSPKVILATAVWIVYALALHSPMNPAARGRRSAVLSIVGFVLMFGTLIAVQFMPAGGMR